MPRAAPRRDAAVAGLDPAGKVARRGTARSGASPSWESENQVPGPSGATMRNSGSRPSRHARERLLRDAAALERPAVAVAVVQEVEDRVAARRATESYDGGRTTRHSHAEVGIRCGLDAARTRARRGAACGGAGRRREELPAARGPSRAGDAARSADAAGRAPPGSGQRPAAGRARRRAPATPRRSRTGSRRARRPSACRATASCPPHLPPVLPLRRRRRLGRAAEHVLPLAACGRPVARHPEPVHVLGRQADVCRTTASGRRRSRPSDTASRRRTPDGRPGSKIFQGASSQYVSLMNRPYAASSCFAFSSPSRCNAVDPGAALLRVHVEENATYGSARLVRRPSTR